MIFTIVIFIIILTIIVLIHEAGHYFAAKFFKVKVEEFGFGFPPRALSIKRGETVYSINWLPIGGFVKLYGEDEAGGGKLGSGKLEVSKDKDVHRAFFARPAWQRLIIVVAGVVMNVILAFLIYYAFLAASGFQTELPRFGSYRFFAAEQQEHTQLIISQVQKNSPAANAGIRVDAGLLKINNQPVSDNSTVLALIKQHAGKPVQLTTLDLQTHKTQTYLVTPRVNPAKGQGAIGIGFLQVDTLTIRYLSPLQRLFSGITYPINFVAYNFIVLGQFIHIAEQTHNASVVTNNISGPVGIGSVVNFCLNLPSTRDKTLCVLNISGAISISLAVFNILPIPALDGGRFFFILLELVFRRKISPNVESLIHTVGMAILLFLILLVTLKDINQLIK